VNEMLTHVNFNCCSNIKDNFVVSLCKAAPKLVHLDVGSTSITDISLQAVCKYLKYLRFFRVGGTNFSQHCQSAVDIYQDVEFSNILSS
jgi:hypothetical protein